MRGSSPATRTRTLRGAGPAPGPSAGRRRSRLLAALVGALALVAPACGWGDASSGGGEPGGTGEGGSGLSGEVLVAAAASLTDAFTDLGEAFEDAHPDVTVTFTFDSSSRLAAQVRGGAPVDVFAPADETEMEDLAEEDLVAGEPVVVATNRLVIVTEPGNPGAIDGLEDLRGAGIVALCATEAPCGRLADEVLDAAGIEVPEGEVTRGQSARATLTAVTDGDAVAGVVYATDAVAAGDAVEAVPVPEAHGAVASYPIALVAAAGDDQAARGFVDLVTSEDGLEVLRRHGFLPPP